MHERLQLWRGEAELAGNLAKQRLTDLPGAAVTDHGGSDHYAANAHFEPNVATPRILFSLYFGAQRTQEVACIDCQ